jgi:hypothetical protein
MSSDFLFSPLFLAGVALGLVGVLIVFSGLLALARWRPLRFTVRALSGALVAMIGLLLVTIAIGIQGYSALTHETLAATVDVRPLGAQRFAATFSFPDGRERTFELAGDELYVDAHILKWKPIANLVGLHTAYELDRVAGRYRALEAERAGPRTVEQLSPERPVDLFALRRRYTALAPLLDAEYGSATFVPVSQPARLELRVSTSGLLMRERTMR